MELRDEVKKLIEEWLESKRGATLGKLSQLSGIKYNTVLRYSNGSCDDPSLNVLMSLVPVLLPVESHGRKGAEFLVRHFPNVASFIDAEEKSSMQTLTGHDELDSITREEFLVLTYACEDGGLSHAKALEEFGRKKAIDAIDKLLKIGALQDKGGIYVTSQKAFKLLKATAIVKEISILCDLFDFEKSEEVGQFTELTTQGLNAEGMRKMQDVLCEARLKMREIQNTAKFHGPNIMGYGIVSTLLGQTESES